MQFSIIALLPLALSASALSIVKVEPAVRAVDDGVKGYAAALARGFQSAGPPAEGLEKRIDVCPLNECQDRCNFTPPLCTGDFCDWNNLGCLAGCCVACGGC